MGSGNLRRLVIALSALVGTSLALAGQALAAPAGIRIIDDGTDVGMVIAVAVMGVAGGLLLAIVAENDR